MLKAFSILASAVTLVIFSTSSASAMTERKDPRFDVRGKAFSAMKARLDLTHVDAETSSPSSDEPQLTFSLTTRKASRPGRPEQNGDVWISAGAFIDTTVQTKNGEKTKTVYVGVKPDKKGNPAVFKLDYSNFEGTFCGDFVEEGRKVTITVSQSCLGVEGDLKLFIVTFTENTIGADNSNDRVKAMRVTL